MVLHQQDVICILHCQCLFLNFISVFVTMLIAITILFLHFSFYLENYCLLNLLVI